ncbi:hypothetical protein Hypma_002257 [Hypsizygus marmoreus]|uniref:Uncharacterized protein n=1 Tax=Hypsizygus marmoreus TaxID=39966 RepID=A0A369JZU4_HYPMA|nr:hypothetical protein Hypma_002257 [Hypsizygus marmoreus]
MDIRWFAGGASPDEAVDSPNRIAIVTIVEGNPSPRMMGFFLPSGASRLDFLILLLFCFFASSAFLPTFFSFFSVGPFSRDIRPAFPAPSSTFMSGEPMWLPRYVANDLTDRIAQLAIGPWWLVSVFRPTSSGAIRPPAVHGNSQRTRRLGRLDLRGFGDHLSVRKARSHCDGG